MLERIEQTTNKAAVLTVEIGDISTAELAVVWAGMPAEVVDKVKSLKVGKVTTGKGGTSRVGIMSGSR